MKINFVIALWVMGVAAPSLAEETAKSPERWEAVIAAFEKENQQNPPAPGGVLIYGSSSAVKWKPYQKDLGNFPIANRGFGGSTLAECARYVERAVIPCKPGIVILYAGDNDISQKATPEDVHASFLLLLEHLRKALPDVKVIVFSMKPAPVRKAQYETLKKVSQYLRDECEKGKNLYFLDIWTPMMGDNGEPIPDLFLPDRSHCNAKGYELWVSLLKPVLEPLLEKPASGKKG